jgi:hypothetical protein
MSVPVSRPMRHASAAWTRRRQSCSTAPPGNSWRRDSVVATRRKCPVNYRAYFCGQHYIVRWRISAIFWPLFHACCTRRTRAIDVAPIWFFRDAARFSRLHRLAVTGKSRGFARSNCRNAPPPNLLPATSVKASTPPITDRIRLSFPKPLAMQLAQL